MGAPKQKWTAEEEAALKAGVVKHGPGKWRTILKDPEFSGILYLRSNVDLKDKWRNMSVMTNGLGSRDKSRVTLKRVPVQVQPVPIIKQEEASTSVSVSDVPQRSQSDEEMVDVKPFAASSAPIPMQIDDAGPKRSIVRLDNLIMEAITSLKEPDGSNKTAIATYIEDQYWAPPDFKRVLSAKLKFLTSSGKLVKVKRRYRIAQFPVLSDRRRNHPMIGPEARQLTNIDRDELSILKSHIDLELAKMRTMTPQEASAAAARAVAEAEAAIAEAEEASREADEAEADAEAAQAFAEAATKMLRSRSMPKMIRV